MGHNVISHKILKMKLNKKFAKCRDVWCCDKQCHKDVNP